MWKMLATDIPALVQDFSRLQNFINYNITEKVGVVVVVVEEDEGKEVLC
jgi:hypothetical protein